MIGEPIGEFLEPEEAERGEDFPFVGDAVGHDAVEGADAVGGDDQQVVAGLSSGGTYATLAVAIVLIYRATGVVTPFRSGYANEPCPE